MALNNAYEPEHGQYLYLKAETPPRSELLHQMLGQTVIWPVKRDDGVHYLVENIDAYGADRARELIRLHGDKIRIVK